MKSRSFTVLEWFTEHPNSILHPDALDIDWPKVQREAGPEHIKWLMKQDKTRCQMILEKDQKQGKSRLVAEFYDEGLAVDYVLLWAK
jgi:hypothetical protein